MSCLSLGPCSRPSAGFANGLDKSNPSAPPFAPGPSAPASAPGASAGSPLQGRSLVVGTIALSLATFMNVLDTSIANVSIPTIAGDLGVSPDQGTWVITSFGVANAIRCR